MKLDDDLVEHFEDEQQQYGSRVAIYNLLWTFIADQYKGVLGITNVRAENLNDE